MRPKGALRGRAKEGGVVVDELTRVGYYLERAPERGVEEDQLGNSAYIQEVLGKGLGCTKRTVVVVAFTHTKL